MEKTITITEREFRDCAVQTATEIMEEHSEDAPQGALMFSLACTLFSAMLARKLFRKDEDNE